MDKLNEMKKLLAAVIGAVATYLSVQFADAEWLTAALLVLTALGVYLVPNTQPAPVPPPKKKSG